MKKDLKVMLPSVPKSQTTNLPKPYNAEQEIHRACRDGAAQDISKLIHSNPDLINVQDGKVF